MKRLLLVLALMLVGCPAKEESAAPSASATETAKSLIPLAVGQWTRHRVTRDDGTQSTIRYQVVAEEAGAFWVEVASGDGSGTVIQLLLRRTGEDAELMAGRVRSPDGQIKESRGKDFETHKEGFRQAISGTLLPKMAGLPQKDITVPAGTFQGCFEEVRTTTVTQITAKNRTYVHPSVPITGLVKSETIGEQHKMELEAFGLTGAKSSM
ncbi:MAG: hypothetical protein R3B13_08935 [Polyangiaceae bacterium]